MIWGHDEAVARFRRAWDSRTIHHAWLLAGPRGIGKASFAYQAARRILAEAAGPPFDLPGIQTPIYPEDVDDEGRPREHRIAHLIREGSHPDMRWLQRLPKEKGDGLSRDITV